MISRHLANLKFSYHQSIWTVSANHQLTPPGKPTFFKQNLASRAEKFGSFQASLRTNGEKGYNGFPHKQDHLVTQQSHWSSWSKSHRSRTSCMAPGPGLAKFSLTKHQLHHRSSHSMISARMLKGVALLMSLPEWSA